MHPKLFILILAIISGIPLASLKAQEDLRAVDPSDVFYRGWQAVKSAEKLEKGEQFNEAWKKYQQASKYFETLKRFHANWKPNIVDGRISSTAEALKNIEPKAVAELANKNKLHQDLIEGGITEQTPPNQSQAGVNHIKAPQLAGATSAAPINGHYEILKRNAQKLEQENTKLRKELNQRLSPSNPKPDIATQERLKQVIQEKDQEIKNIRNLLARAPIQQDLDRLSQENLAREKEINLVAGALKQSKRKLAEAQQRAQDKQAEADLAKNRIEQITKDMNEQQGLNNLVIENLRKEMKSLNSILENTRLELGSSRTEVQNLKTQLEQSQSLVTELTEERDALRTERDALSEILQQNDSQGIQKLITENMRLGTDLKQANDRLAYLEKSNDSTKDELVEAKSNLAIAKTRISQYQEEQKDYLVRIKSLENELNSAKTELELAEQGTNGNVNQEEVEILKKTVNRLIAGQERRRVAEKILWDTYQESKVTIAGMAEAFHDIRDANVELSDEEKVILSNRLPDQEFQSPQRVPMAHARAHGEALKNEVKGFMPLVVRAFEKQRYEAARQILTDLDERFPGNIQVLCTRGVVELKTNNYQAASNLFQEAITMDENSDYAHYMLGVTYYKNQDFDNAHKSFDRSLSIKPTNEKTHLYLGCIAGMGKRFEQSEEHFLTAIKLDPTYADAYYNLSALYLQQNRKFDAQQYYQKALQNGKAPNTLHEVAIGNLKG